MIYVTDTHSLIWFLSDNRSLSTKAREIFEITEKGKNIIVIPTIVLAELFHICEKKNILNLFSEIINKLKTGTNYIVYNLDLDVIIECKNLNKIPEMHDKIIAATTKILGVVLITKDQEIQASAYIKTIW